jgi:hypothetical protein
VTVRCEARQLFDQLLSEAADGADVALLEEAVDLVNQHPNHRKADPHLAERHEVAPNMYRSRPRVLDLVARMRAALSDIRPG